MQADILSQVVLPLALFVIMMGMGLSLKVGDFTAVAQKPKAILLGVGAQLLLLPVLALVLVSIFELPPYVAVGFFIIALCPSGTTSNLFTYLAKGDVALSVSLTALISLITPFTIPIALLAMMTLTLGEGQVVEVRFTYLTIKTIVVGVDYDIGITLARKDDPTKNIVCLNGPSSPHVWHYPEVYSALFYSIAGNLRKRSYYNASIVDDILETINEEDEYNANMACAWS